MPSSSRRKKKQKKSKLKSETGQQKVEEAKKDINRAYSKMKTTDLNVGQTFVGRKKQILKKISYHTTITNQKRTTGRNHKHIQNKITN